MKHWIDALRSTAAVAVVLTLAACGGGGGGSNDPPPTGAQPLRTFGAPSLTPELDTSRARGAYIGARGGRVEVELADGTRGTLEVPPGALSEQVLITLTPVARLGGLPLDGGLVAAIDMQPAGLVFAAPALLRIELSDTAAPLTVAFGWSGDERRFAIVPGAPESGRRFRVAIEHFSGYGLGIAGPSQLDALAGELVDLDDENERAWSSILNADLETDCSGACTEADYTDWAQDFWDLITKPRLDDGVDGPVQALVGHKALDRFIALRYYLFGNETGQPLAGLQAAGLAQDLANLKRQHDAYTRPQCSGTVTDWKDWVRIPDELRARVVTYYPDELDDFPELFSDTGFFDEPTGSSCVHLKADFIDPPRVLGDDDFRIPLRLRARIVHPGGELPVSARVFMDYSDGAEGPAEVQTDASGEGMFDVDRDLTWPGVSVTALAIEESVRRTTVTGAFAFANLGQSALTIKSSGQHFVVPAGTEEEVWIQLTVDGVPIEGAEVGLTFEGPGRINLDDEVTDSDGYIRGTYTAPPYPVPRNYVAVARVQATHDGQTYQARADIQPQWADLTLEVNDGTAWLPATNRTVTVDGDGPFALRTSVQVSGEMRADPPRPVPPGGFVGLTTAEATLAQAGNCCADLALSYLDSEGRGETVDWRANGSVRSTQTIEAIYPNLAEGGVGASVTLSRVVAGITVDLAYVLPVGVDRPLVVTVRDSLGRPVPGAAVSTSATGGSASGGTTGDDGVLRGTARLASADEPLVVELSVTAPGGGLIDTRTVSATPAPPVEVGNRDPRGGIVLAPLFISRIDTTNARTFVGTLGQEVTLSSDCATATFTGWGTSNVSISRLQLVGSATDGCSVSLSLPITFRGDRTVIADMRGVTLAEYSTQDSSHFRLLVENRGAASVELRGAPYYYRASARTSRDDPTIDVELVFSELTK